MARTMGDGMTAEAFIRRIKRLCVSDQIWREKNYRPACCLALIMLSVFILGTGSVYGLGRTSNSLTPEAKVITEKGKSVPFKEAELTRVKASALDELDAGVAEVTADSKCIHYSIEAGETLTCLIRPGDEGDYILIVMGNENYEIYFCDTEKQVWHGYIENTCQIPIHIPKGENVYLRIRNIGNEESVGVIGWRLPEA